ncbi:enoyl-CoA hydratase-related protein [Gordonia rhizosphera]|uniref:enoyl-CoA hydratase-related protein n=1 Tax=Gordonia rhizosphera TaxID=83341 RepID=UPI0002DFA2BB|nr:enoyl-CoA hydratase-related protein [Gordonia rhizosphera]
MSRARDMLYTGRQVSAELALDWGLVTEISDEVLTHTLAVAEKIALAAPIASRLAKTCLEQSAAGLEASLQ